MPDSNTAFAQDVAQDIQAAIDDDALDLPTLPEVALRIRDEAESENVSAISLATVVGDDPGLAAQLVRVANSPMFRATRSIDDLSQAISRLGVEYAANIVTGLAMQQMFQATSEMIDRKMRSVWKSATELAAWSATLSKRIPGLRQDQATLAGLTHSIGVLPILSWAEENDHLLRDSLTLDQVIESIHPTIGRMILSHWNFADELVEVPQYYSDPTYTPANANQATYVDAVGAAYLINANHQNGTVTPQPQWEKLGSFKRLQLDWTDDALTQELAEEVETVKGVLT